VKIKAILYTDVFISSVFWKGPPFEILKAWQEQRLRLAISPPIPDEYRPVVDERACDPCAQLDPQVDRASLHPEMVEPLSFSKPICRDPDDDVTSSSQRLSLRRKR
jgi:predicted nucleic acid-binding protein